MYLNKIDLLLDKITDDFYATIIKTQVLNKILAETNFVKFQKENSKYAAKYLALFYLKNYNKKLDEKTERLRRADSVMAISVARLEVLNQINNISHQYWCDWTGAHPP